MAVQSGDTIKIHYHGRLADGSTFDSSAGRSPLEFTVGSGSVIKGFDDGVQGMSVGEKKTIEISDFVKEEEISSLYYETPYYLEPDKSGTRAYELLRQALLKSKKVGIATFVMRSKESLAVLRPAGERPAAFSAASRSAA